MNTEISKTNEPNKFVLKLSQRLDFRTSNKHVLFQNLYISYKWKNIRKQYKNNKLKILAPAWSYEFDLRAGTYSVSDIQDYIEYIIKKHETLTINPSIHVYINKINNRLVFKIKERYKLELQRPETNFGSTKKLKDKKKRKNAENVPSLEVVEVVLVQSNSVDNQYQQKSEVLYTITQNKSYTYLLNVEPSNLVFLKIHNTEFHEIIITFTGKNGRPLEIEEKVNLTLLNNK